jgi:hypothetical protein
VKLTLDFRFALRLAGLGLALAAAACSGDGNMADGGPDRRLPGDPDAGWTTVFEGNTFDKAVLSVWGSGPRDVYFAGGGLQTPGSEGPLALHFDYQTFTPLDASAAGTATLWWVNGGPAIAPAPVHDGGPTDAGVGAFGTQVWFVGEQGMAFRLGDDKQTLEKIETGTTATLFGVFVAGVDDVWAVGGSPLGGGDNDVILHYTKATGFQKVDPPQKLGLTYYKVHGNGSSDIYACGTGGTVLHYDGTSWKAEETGVHSLLFTIWAAGPSVYTVGGFPAVVLSRTIEGTWEVVNDVMIGTVAYGVNVLGDGTTLVVGGNGAKWRRLAGKWYDDTLLGTTADLHSTWQDGDGDAFAVGGDFASPTSAMRHGVIARHGRPVPSKLAPAPGTTP